MIAFPPLQADIRCDVAVIGGGSTAASTALLQYEIDTHLIHLAKRYGEDTAVLAYQGCATAIAELRALAAGVRDVDFAMEQSLYYASRWRDKSSLQDEVATKPAFSWTGTFTETADGLPFFGPHAEYGSRVLFAMAYGGNGLSYSMIDAGLLRAAIEGRRHSLAQLFSFKRIG